MNGAEDDLTVDIYRTVHMIHHALIKQCNRVFTCKEKRDHHTLAQSYLGIFRSWQRNKNYNTELHINKKAQILFTMLVLGIKWIPIAKKKLACRTPPFERTLIHYATRDGKEAEDGGQKGGFAP